MIKFTRVRWKNFLSTGNAFTEIHLDRSPDTLIVGDNGSGKSTMLDALCFGLFGKPFRKIKKDQIINSVNERGALVEVEFVTKSRHVRIVRGIKPSVFEIHVDGQMIDQVAASKDYQEHLERHILHMNMKSFTQVVILGSSSFVPFMQLPTGIRREVIEDLLDIQVFSMMSSLLKDRVQSNDYEMSTNFNEIASLEKMISAEQDRERHERDAVEEKIRELRSREESVSANLASAESSEEAVRAEIAEVTSSTSGYGKIESRLTEIGSILLELGKKIKRVETRVKFFVDNDDCPTCGQVISDDLRASQRDQGLAEVAELSKAKTALDEKREAALAALNSLEETRRVLPKLSSRANDLRTAAAVARRELEYIRSQINEMSRGAEAFSRARLDELRAQLDVSKTARESLVGKQSLYSMASVMLKDSGIKARIVKQYVPIINQLVNRYLAAMDFFVRFELDEKFEERILSRHRDDFTYDSFSEGEKMRIDLALLFTWRAVAKSKNSVSTNLLILDEVFDASLDVSGCEEFLKLIHTLENTNVFVISHKGDALADKFRSMIKFEKQGNYSRIAA